MEGHIFVADAAFHIGERLCVRRIHNLRFGLHHVQEAAETGQTFLHHFDQFYKDLDRTDENTDVQGIHCEICDIHEIVGDEISAEYKCHEIHHALKERFHPMKFPMQL